MVIAAGCRGTEKEEEGEVSLGVCGGGMNLPLFSLFSGACACFLVPIASSSSSSSYSENSFAMAADGLPISLFAACITEICAQVFPREAPVDPLLSDSAAVREFLIRVHAAVSVAAATVCPCFLTVDPASDRLLLRGARGQEVPLSSIVLTSLHAPPEGAAIHFLQAAAQSESQERFVQQLSVTIDAVIDAAVGRLGEEQGDTVPSEKWWQSAEHQAVCECA